MDFWIADEAVIERANNIIKEHRPELVNATIVYYFKEKASKKAGKITLATAKKVAPKENVIHSFDGKPDLTFAIEIAADAWNELTDAQKDAVLHHELCHCGFEEDEAGENIPALMPHDVEEFSEVVKAHGFYMNDIQKFVAEIMEKNAEKEKNA